MVNELSTWNLSPLQLHINLNIQPPSWSPTPENEPFRARRGISLRNDLHFQDEALSMEPTGNYSFR